MIRPLVRFAARMSTLVLCAVLAYPLINNQWRAVNVAGVQFGTFYQAAYVMWGPPAVPRFEGPPSMFDTLRSDAVPLPTERKWPRWRSQAPGAYVLVPLWMLFVPSAAAALVAWRRRSRAYVFWSRRHDPRLAPGHCQKCGYNLTGNVSGRCPECATPTDTSPERERRVTTAQPSVVDSGDRDQASAG